MSRQPNVLLVLTDQQFAGAMSCAGNDELETPGMDRIADRGTRFSDAYCTDPICTPSRTSMMTGRMPHDTGVTWFETGDEEFWGPDLGELFAEAGYECRYAGKWHIGSVALPGDGAHGFQKLLDGWLDDDVADASTEYLRDEPEEPFFLVTSFTDPHDICEWASGRNTPHGAPEDVPIGECPALPKNFSPPPFEPELVREAVNDPEWRDSVGAMKNASPTEWRRYRHAYYRMVERVDARVERVLDALEDAELADDTVVVFTSDHGDGLGAHQLNQKHFLYEESVRVPFIVSYPGETAEGNVDDHVVSVGLDLLPTLCDYAGISLSGYDLHGQSVRDLVAGGPPDEWREFVVTETYRPVEGRMLRTDRYKYVVYHHGARREQLFDLENDPGEMVDLAENSDYEDVLADHREKLTAWCEETGDHSVTWTRSDGFSGLVRPDSPDRR